MKGLIALGALVAGAVFTAIGLAVAPYVFSGARHRRTNYRGRTVFATGGVVLLKPVVVGALLSMAEGSGTRTAWTIAWAGAAMWVLGLLDDVYGDRRAGGFFGHARELVHGKLTTGMLKAIGGGTVGLGAAWATGWRGAWILAAGAVVALAANLANLLDLRPGRMIKAWLACVIPLLVAGVRGGGAVPLWAGIGAVAVFGVHELREEVMLGDTGAGLLGAVAGVAVIATVGRTGLLIVLGGLVALTVASEVVSFTRVIDAVPPLRYLDRLGRKG